MRIAVTGSTGLVGTALVQRLGRESHMVRRVVRGDAAGDAIVWDPDAGKIELEKLAGLNAVVHLAGENIAEGRWTDAKKTRIRDSRVKGTEFLCESLAALDHRPQTLISASAIGYYGDRRAQECDEGTSPGGDFLSGVCVAWEAATQPAVEAGIRVVNLRIGIVLSPNGGALAKMLLPFKLCAGGRIGSGNQYWSWVSLDDVVGIIAHALKTESLSGPVNAVSPRPVTNREFTKALGRVLARPTIFPMPSFAAKLALGEMADALMLSSTRVVPGKLQQSGYEFQHADLETTLRSLLTSR